jgi:hypothetical protein
MTDSYSCPQCSSEQTQRVDVIHASGFSTSLGVGGGAALGDGGLTPGLGVFGSTKQTALSKKFAPPKMPKLRDAYSESVAGGAIAAIVVGLPVYVVLYVVGQYAWPSIAPPQVAMVVAALCAIAPARRAYRYVQTWGIGRNNPEITAQYERAMALWKSLWFCHRCGCTFVPNGCTATIVEPPSASAPPGMDDQYRRACERHERRKQA